MLFDAHLPAKVQLTLFPLLSLLNVFDRQFSLLPHHVYDVWLLKLTAGTVAVFEFGWVCSSRFLLESHLVLEKSEIIVDGLCILWKTLKWAIDCVVDNIENTTGFVLYLVYLHHFIILRLFGLPLVILIESNRIHSLIDHWSLCMHVA